MRSFHLGDGQNENSENKTLIDRRAFLSQTMDPYKDYKNARQFRSELNLVHERDESEEDDIGKDRAGGELNCIAPITLNQPIGCNKDGGRTREETRKESAVKYDDNNNEVISSQKFSLLVKSCGKVHHLLVVANNPDGNCLFRAISQALHKNENHYNEIRCRVVEFISSDEKWQEYFPHIKGQYENLSRKLRHKNGGLWSSVKKHRPKFLSSTPDKEGNTSSAGSSSSTTNNSNTCTNSNSSKSEEKFAWAEESEDFKALYIRYMTVDKCYGSLQELLAAADMYSFNVVIVREFSDGHYNILNFNEKGHPNTFYFLFTGLADDGHFELLLPQRVEEERDICNINKGSGSSSCNSDSGVHIHLRSGDYQQVGYNQHENWALIAEVEERIGSALRESPTRKRMPSIEINGNVDKKNKMSDVGCAVPDEIPGWRDDRESNTDIFAKEKLKTHVTSSICSKPGINKKVSPTYVHPCPSAVVAADGYAGDADDTEDERYLCERQNVNHFNPLSRRRKWKHLCRRPMRIARNTILCLCCPYLFTKGFLTRHNSASGYVSD